MNIYTNKKITQSEYYYVLITVYAFLCFTTKTMRSAS